MPHLRTHATLYSVHKLVLPDIKNDFESKKENGEELKIVRKNNLLNVEYSSCRVSGSQNGREK